MKTLVSGGKAKMLFGMGKERIKWLINYPWLHLVFIIEEQNNFKDEDKNEQVKGTQVHHHVTKISLEWQNLVLIVTDLLGYKTFNEETLDSVGGFNDFHRTFLAIS
uniref:Uncharacterized protein n=1 Tax=Tetranychus urticae TaxID=32264 RepID=T1KCI2_TETUR